MKPEIKNFEAWVFESQLPKIEADNSARLTFTQNLLDTLLEKDDITFEEHMSLLVLRESNTSYDQWNDLNESFSGALKKMADKITSGAKSGADMVKKFAKDTAAFAQEEIAKLPEFFEKLKKGAQGFIDMVVNFVKKLYENTIGNAIEWVKKKVGGDESKVKSELEAIAKDSEKSSQIKSEAVTIGKMAKGYKNSIFGGKLEQGLEDGLEKVEDKLDSEDVKSSDLMVATSESELPTIEDAIMEAILVAVKESSMEEVRSGFDSLSQINEGGDGHTSIPFASKISAILEKIPPFSWLKDLAEYISNNVNDALNYVGKISQEKGIIKEAVDFVIIGALVGLVLEKTIKGLAKHSIVAAVPPVYGAVALLGTIATGIWCVHMASTVIDGFGDAKDALSGEGEH